jgi:hypothetical protein
LRCDIISTATTTTSTTTAARCRRQHHHLILHVSLQLFAVELIVVQISTLSHED